MHTCTQCMYSAFNFSQGDPTQAPYPKFVWTPCGGWYCDPPNWKRNTTFAALFIIASSGVAWYVSAQLEVSLSPIRVAFLSILSCCDALFISYSF